MAVACPRASRRRAVDAYVAGAAHAPRARRVAITIAGAVTRARAIFARRAVPRAAAAARAANASAAAARAPYVRARSLAAAEAGPAAITGAGAVLGACAVARAAAIASARRHDEASGRWARRWGGRWRQQQPAEARAARYAAILTHEVDSAPAATARGAHTAMEARVRAGAVGAERACIAGIARARAVHARAVAVAVALAAPQRAVAPGERTIALATASARYCGERGRIGVERREAARHGSSTLRQRGTDT